MKGVFYSVFLDGNFIGTVENEDYIWDLAQDCVNGTPYPLTDDNMPDRVWYEKININRFYNDGKNIIDKIEPQKSILCYNEDEAKNGSEKLNEINIKKERAEAKIRAMTL